jgi:hypothetical protein
MLLPRAPRTLLWLVAALLTSVVATAAGKGSHVKEQDVNLDDDAEDDSAPEKKPPPDQADADDAPDEAPREKSRVPVDAADDRTTSSEKPRIADDDASADPAVWLSLGLMQDVAFISGNDVCSEKSQVSGGFTCVRSSGSQYHGTPLAGSGGKLGGVSLAASRVTLASNVRLSDKFSAGVRLGYAFLGQGPKPDGGKDFLSLSAEAEGAYWLSSHAYSTRVVGTFVELSAGLAEVDGKSKVTVRENTMVPPPVSQLDNPATQPLSAYKKAGAGFAGVGAGLFVPVGRRAGLIVDLRVIQLFPSSGTGLSLGLAGAFGL